MYNGKKTGKQQIRAIIFDMGGVLIDLNLDTVTRSFSETLGYAHTEGMLDPSHGKGLYMQIEEGKLTAEEFRQAVKADSRPGVTDEMVDQAMWSFLEGIMPGKPELLESLATRYDLYLLSNNNPISWVRCCEIFEEAGIPVPHLFKKSFLSYQMKKLKPCREIFEEVIAAIPQYEPAEMLVIDDSEANTRMAAESGMKVLHYPQGSDLAAAIAAVTPIEEEEDGQKRNLSTLFAATQTRASDHDRTARDHHLGIC